MINIQKNSAFIDFYVDKLKYEAYKTDRGRNGLVERTLLKIASDLKLTKLQGVEIREVNIKYWGKRSVVNDLNYNCNNEVPLNLDKLTFRLFDVDIISIVLEGERDIFLNISKPNFYIGSAMAKII